MISHITKNKIILVLSLLIIIIGVVGLFVYNPVDAPLAPKCVFKMLTGLSCPGCGFQRAVHSLLHGRFYEAIHYNFFLVLTIPYLFALVSVVLFQRKRWAQRIYPWIYNRYLGYLYIFLLLVWWVVRNIWDL